MDVFFEIESLVEGFLRAVEPGLRKSLHEWDLEKVPPERSLSPDETYYKRMFEASSRTWSDYSLKPVPISSALVVLDLTTVELDHRICGEDSKHIRFQIANLAYDRRSAIDVIIGTDIYSFSLRDGSQYLEEPIVQCTTLGGILTRKAKSAMDTPQDQTANYLFIKVTPDLSKKPQELRELEEFLGRVSSQEEGYFKELVKASRKRDSFDRHLVQFLLEEEPTDMDKSGPHVIQAVKTYLETLKLGAHPPYFSDLAPSDYHLFQSMTHGLSEQKFSSYEDIKKWIDS